MTLVCSLTKMAMSVRSVRDGDRSAGRFQHGGLRDELALGDSGVDEDLATLLGVGAVETDDDRRTQVDATQRLDDALRHFLTAGDATEELDDREQLARTHDLQYIGLDGSVGIIANGAGLAMSTLDVVNQVGGTAANFLDIGGGANADVMAAALEVINFDKEVKSIFINIFGGITRGEEVAKGIVEAMSRVDLRAPIVIRLDGTNAEQGREILANAGIPESKLISKPTMLDAARAAVALANGAN